MGETPKNVAAVFRLAREQNAVLLFDEADAIASRRSTALEHAFQRETNTVVSVLLQELEMFNGVVIFATNMAANFDPRLRAPDPDARAVRNAGRRGAREDLARADAPAADAARAGRQGYVVSAAVAVVPLLVAVAALVVAIMG